MKCSYCGKKVEDGANVCPYCGMIFSVSAAEESDVPVLSNVFKASVKSEPFSEIKAQEIPASPVEESVEVVESVPEFENEVFEAVKEEPVQEEAPATEETADEPETEEPEIQAEESGEIADSGETQILPQVGETEPLISEDSSEQGIPELEIRVPTGEISYPEYDAYRQKQEEERLAIEAEEAEKQDAAAFEAYFAQNNRRSKVKKVSQKKSSAKKGSSVTIAAFFFAFIALGVILCGAYFIKNSIPVSTPDTTTTKAVETSAETEETTEAEETTETEETTEAQESTEESTSAEETTEEETTAPEETTKAEETTTEAETTVSSGVVVTTKPTTTKPTTTKPTTTKPTTTKPTITNPTTTKPTTTDPYGINDVEVQKPSKYFSSSFTGYVTEEGVNLRSGASTSYARVLYLSKGADLKVLAEKDGFYYVYSNRYGVYGWVSKTFVAKSRPQADSSAYTAKGTVTPDKKYGTVTVKNTTDGLNLRKGPGTSYGIVSLIPKDYPVKVIGYKQGVSGWVYVLDTTYGIYGWVSSAYLK